MEVAGGSERFLGDPGRDETSCNRAWREVFWLSPGTNFRYRYSRNTNKVTIAGVLACMRVILLTFIFCACGSSPQALRNDAQSEAAPAPRRIEPLPAKRHGHRAHIVENELLVIGGFSSSASGRGTSHTWIQDLDTGAWRQAASLNQGKAFASSVVVDGIVYAVGSSIERYDQTADRWDVVLPGGEFPKTHFGAALIGRKIIAVGGYPIEQSGVKAFDLDTGEVTNLPLLPGFTPGDHFHFVVNLRGELHVIGGLRVENFTPSAQHWVFDVDGWRAATPPPAPVWAKFAIWAVLDDQLYLFAGYGFTRDDALGPTSGFRYDSRSDTWTVVAVPPKLLAMPATVVLDGRLHVLGGQPLDDGPFPTAVTVYEPKEDSW